MILNRHGKPFSDTLGKEIAAPSLYGMRTVWNVSSMADDLTPERLAEILRSANMGNHHDYLTLAEEMEEREPHYASVLGTRKRAVSGLEIQVEAAGESSEQKEHTEAVRKIVKKPAFGELIDDLLDGIGKGYSVCEIMWNTGKIWTPEKYIWRDPRFFTFSDDDDQTLRLADETDYVNGVPLPPQKFIIHRPKLKSGIPARGGLARLACATYMCKSFTLSDWMTFAELFGMPLRLGKYGKQAKSGDIEKLMMAVANIASDAAAVIPDSMNIDFIDRGKSTGGDKLFITLAEWLDKQTSKAVLGQTMTADDGSSNAQANVHNEVRHDILKADAKALGNTLDKDLILPFIDLNYGVQEAYPHIRLVISEPEDVKALVEALAKLVPQGLKVKAKEVREKLGLSDPQDGDEVLGVEIVHAENRSIDEERELMSFYNRMWKEKGEIDFFTHKKMQDYIENSNDWRVALNRNSEDELEGDWEKLIAPVLDPIEKLAAECANYEEFQAKLPSLHDEIIDALEIAKHMTELTFKEYAEGIRKDEL